MIWRINSTASNRSRGDLESQYCFSSDSPRRDVIEKDDLSIRYEPILFIRELYTIGIDTQTISCSQIASRRLTSGITGPMPHANSLPCEVRGTAPVHAFVRHPAPYRAAFSAAPVHLPSRYSILARLCPPRSAAARSHIRACFVHFSISSAVSNDWHLIGVNYKSAPCCLSAKCYRRKMCLNPSPVALYDGLVSFCPNGSDVRGT